MGVYSLEVDGVRAFCTLPHLPVANDHFRVFTSITLESRYTHFVRPDAQQWIACVEAFARCVGLSGYPRRAGGNVSDGVHFMQVSLWAEGAPVPAVTREVRMQHLGEQKSV